MSAKSIAKAATFKAATEDLVSSLQIAIRQDELSPTDREWLMGELDELIDELKNAKAKLPRMEAVEKIFRSDAYHENSTKNA
ncbi:MAG: hypothetical protein HY842_17075 [Bacteroidetes bacterium]|nr:hypothetical protein [Bacteroidota bacterium]